jgi:RimJ/RimL family protein N-acetyltransferase
VQDVPLIQTERLILRAPRMDDAEAIFESYASDPEVTRYLIWRPHCSVADTKDFLTRLAESPAHSREINWAITQSGEDLVRGMIGLRPQGHMAEVGYVLSRRFWGRGYMTESLRAVVAFAFAMPQMYRVWAVCDAENVASARVMEKAGLRFEGILQRYVLHPNISREPRDARCYAITK